MCSGRDFKPPISMKSLGTAEAAIRTNAAASGRLMDQDRTNGTAMAPAPAITAIPGASGHNKTASAVIRNSTGVGFGTDRAEELVFI